MQPFISHALLATRIAEMHREAQIAQRVRDLKRHGGHRRPRTQVRPADRRPCIQLTLSEPQQTRSVHANRVAHGHTGVSPRQEEQAMIKELKASLRGRRSRGPSRTGWGGPGRRAIAAGLGAVAVAALVAACGGPGGIYGTSGGSAAGTAHQAPASHGEEISARTLPGVGTVLVNRSGKTLYSPQQEAHGAIMCTGGCLSFWFPVPATTGATMHAPAGVTGVLGTVHRPGGLTQLTYNGKPLYTFRLDQAPGQAHGNNFTDHFGAASFTWHAVTTSGAPTGTGQPGNASGSAYQGGSRGY